MLLQQRLQYIGQHRAGTCTRQLRLLLTTRTAPATDAAHAVHALASQPRASGTRVVEVRSVATENLTGQPLVLGSYDEAVFEPSHDLRELAAAQLHSLFQVLRRVSPGSHGSCKACVYARRADSLDAPQMKLQRVACCKSAQLPPSVTLGYSGGSSSSNPGSNNSFEELDEILTLHRAAWEPGSSNGSSSCETEALLINEEIVLLPSSNLLVLPLAEAGVLVGLLVVEVLSKPGSPIPHQPQPLRQQDQQQQGQPAWELPPVLGLSEDVLWALRMSVPPLAKACAMDLRAALAGAQQEARQRLARSLLLEARGPLKVLGTFGTMLAPRLRTGQSGEPESDMADGMILQGQRLADVVAQLEAALRPPPRPVGQANFSSSSGEEWVEVQQQQQQQPWREALALPAAALDDGNMSDEDDSWACAESPAQQQQQQDVRAASAGGSAVGRPKLLGPGSSQQQQQVVVADLVPGQHTAESLESSSRDIRWSKVEAPAPKVVVPAALQVKTGSGTGSSEAAQGSSSISSIGSSSLYVPSTGFDAAKTIELELMPDSPGAASAAAAAGAEDSALWASSTSSSSSNSSSGTISSAVQAAESGLGQLMSAAAAAADSDTQQQRQLQHQQQQQQLKRPVQRGVCNVVDVLNHLLSAAAGLAQLQGINLIINDPLSLDPTSSSSSRSRSSTSSSSSTALVLLPRPVRPLLAGVAGNVCRRVLGYCVDVALQCTPRGGQLCVTARASSGGVEVSLMHTGQAQPNRLHTSTASMDAAALGPAADAPTLAAEGANGAAGSLLRKRKRKQPGGSSLSSSRTGSSLATSNTNPPNSSSRWSTGLQELSSSSGIRGGSSLITLDFARQILHSVGGRLSLTYPYHFINAMTGQLEVGSNIEVWLPPPAPTAG